MKKVSVITINYNNSEGLRKTIQSIINQTFIDYEYIVIDGGSTDGSTDIIKEYADHIDYWVSEPDKGIYNAMNKGILKATGEYCNFMNSGDCFYRNEVLEYIFSGQVQEDILIGKYYGSIIKKAKPYSTPITMRTLYQQHPCHQATFIKRELFQNHLYDESYKIASDWKFFIEMIAFNQCSYKYYDYIITEMDQTGISSTNHKLSEEECQAIMSEFLPSPIISDYNYWKEINSPFLKLLPSLNKTKTLRRIIYYSTYILLSIYSFFTKKKP